MGRRGRHLLLHTALLVDIWVVLQSPEGVEVEVLRHQSLYELGVAQGDHVLVDVEEAEEDIVVLQVLRLVNQVVKFS